MCKNKIISPKAKHYRDKVEARKYLKFDIHARKNFTKDEYNKFQRAISLGEQVLNSIEFKNKVLSAKFRETDNKSNKEIYDMFMSGKDAFNKEIDSDIDIYISMYYSANKVIGYTYPSTYKTWMNRKFFKKFDVTEILGNLVHEYCHNLGFGHNIRVGRSNTVPYRIGYIARDLGKFYL